MVLGALIFQNGATLWVHQAASISEATADVYMLVIWLPSSVQNIHGGKKNVEFVLSKAKVFPRLG